jgi:hypothetical protein
MYASVLSQASPPRAPRYPSKLSSAGTASSADCLAQNPAEWKTKSDPLAAVTLPPEYHTLGID